MLTVNDLYLDARARLRRAGVTMFELEARELVRGATGMDRLETLLHGAKYVPDAVQAKAEQMLMERLSGMPLAYILGQWDFCGLTLTVTPDVLIPRDDTALLAELSELACRAAAPPPRLLDLCCGSGCVGLAVSARIDGLVAVFCDISEAALAVARRNGKQQANTMSFIPADALSPAPAALGTFDVIACNPPYIPLEDWAALDPSVRCFEPRLALVGGIDGLDFYRAIAAGWTKALRPGGILLLEVGAGQAGAVAGLFGAGASIHADLAGIDRVVAWRRPPDTGNGEMGHG